MTATELFKRGYTELVSVVPPSGRLSQASKIRPESKGKAPGVLYASGSWGGYDWTATAADPARMDRDGANIGLKAANFPAIDIDVKDDHLAALIAATVERFLPAAPMRVGAWPKRLYAFRLEGEPFSKLQLYIDYQDERHLVEILGAGQQYLIGGVHPKTMKPYEWPHPLPQEASNLPTLSRQQAEELLALIEDEVCEAFGLSHERSGTGNLAVRHSMNQESLIASDLDVLQAAVQSIPNTSESFPGREDYIRFGFALRGATQNDPGRGLEILLEWALRANHVTNQVDQVSRDWDTYNGPYELGADYVFDVARRYGFDLAKYQFPCEPAPIIVASDELDADARYSDLWLVDQFIKRFGGRVRYVPAAGKWFAYDGTIWRKDVESAVPGYIRRVCVEIANQVLREGATAAQQRLSEARSLALSSDRTLNAVERRARVDGRVVAQLENFDQQPNLLGTPAGIVDLRTGEVLDSKAERMISKSTAIAPRAGPMKLWDAFLDDATGSNMQLRRYLQKAAGYCLTGHTHEQIFFFFYGEGGRGKGTFVNTMQSILGTYAGVASMNSFVSTKFRNPIRSDMAALAGARLVVAQETEEGHSWDEPLIKGLTGGDSITARFLFQNEFTYKPAFKLLFSGNTRPRINNLDGAMRRRIHIVPFQHPPKEIIGDLGDQLRAEWPAILAWAVEGSRMWMAEKMTPPPVVREATLEYFSDEDPTGRWIAECCTFGEGVGMTRTSEMFESWAKWCDANNEEPGTPKRFSQAMQRRGLSKLRNGQGQSAFGGVMVASEFSTGTVN